MLRQGVLSPVVTRTVTQAASVTQHLVVVMQRGRGDVHDGRHGGGGGGVQGHGQPGVEGVEGRGNEPGLLLERPSYGLLDQLLL